jgi:carboxymethylenebutenolidase
MNPPAGRGCSRWGAAPNLTRRGLRASLTGTGKTHNYATDRRLVRLHQRKGWKMKRQETVKATLSPQHLEQLWAEHLKGEFESKDVEATLATMVDDAYVNHMPVNTGGRGKDALRAFYRDDFIPSWPEDLQITPVNRVIGEAQLVDELHLTFTHSKPMPWLLPNVPPTEKKITIDVVVVVQFRGDKLACERIYWDHAAVLRQAGLLKLE